MPKLIIDNIVEVVESQGKKIVKARIMISGIAFKRDIDDTRETPAVPIIDLLQSHEAEVCYHDPHCPVFPEMKNKDLSRSVGLSPELLESLDCVVIVTDHSAVDYEMMGKHAPLIVDTRNAMDRIKSPTAKIIKA